ncbi:MAG: alpha/beta hydrolase [Alphaproteobacteria bacterium]|nr:alpha/beta hydrolase [Alphaproteobacteria bacterium]
MLSSSQNPRSIFRRTGWWGHVRAIGALLIAIYVLLGAALWWVEPDLIYYPSQQTVPPEQSWISPVRLNTADGETLTAWYSAAEPGCPTILFFDGNAGRPEVQHGRWARMHEQGVGFLAVYYRGYSGSTGSPSEDGLHIDAQSGLSWLMRRGVLPNDVIVHGFSLGSGPATRLAATHAVGGLILEAPFSSMSELITEKLPLYPFGLFMRNAYSSDRWISALDEPVLMVHGTADRLVPSAHSRRLMALAPEPSEFIELPGSTHSSLVSDGLYETVWPFLERYWQASEPPSPRCGIGGGQSQHLASTSAR